MKAKAKAKLAKGKKTSGERTIEKQLVALERRLRGELHEKLGNVQNTSRTDPSELLDIASEGEIDFMSAVSAEAGSATLGEIHRALQKLREGTYGVCETCGSPIKKRRLQVRPFAILCVDCKEKEERRRFGQLPSAAPFRSDSSLTVDLTTEDLQETEEPIDEIFRDVEDIEINEIY